jgi:ankyrin repeat protein
MFTLADTLVNNKHMEFAIMLLKAAVIAAGVDLSDFFLEIVNTRDIVKATVFLELLTPEQKESSSLKALSISVENNDLEMLKLLARNGMNLIQFIRTADPNVIKKTLGMLAEESEILNNLFTDPVPQNNRKLLCGVLQYLSLHSAKKIMDQMLRSFVDVIEFLQETEDPEVIKKTIEIQNENISTLRMLFISLALDPNTKLFSLFLNYVRPDDAKSMINASYTVSSKLSQLPLHQAIISHRPDLAIILLQHGADCAPSDLVTGANALQLSILYRQFAILKDHIKLTPELILQKDKAENNALHIAAFINDAETLKILLDIAPKGRKQENVEKRTPRKVAKQISAAECLDVFAEKEQQIAEKKAQVCKKRKNETPDLPPTTFSSPEEAVLKGSVLQVNTLFSKSKLSKDEQEKALLAALETNDLIKISNALMYCREVDFGILLTAIFEHKPCPSADALICVYERLCLCKQPLPDIKILFDYLIHKTIDTKLNPFEKRKDLHDHSILECLGSIDYRKFSSFLDSYSTRYPIKLLIMPLQKPLAADLLNFLAANGYKDAFKSLLDFRKSLVEDNKDGFFTLINVCVAVQAAGENGQAEFLRSPIFGDQVFSTEDRLSLAGMWSDTKETLPMHFAELGKLEVIKVYAEKCPQYIHRIDLSHHSLLHYAIGKDHAEVVRYLVKELNPPFEITDADRELAKQKDNPEIKEILGIESVVVAAKP